MESNTEGIAIIGMAGKFPGANNLAEFWQNLLNKKESITFFTDEELEQFETNYSELRNDPSYIKARGILKDVDQWDARFFGYTPHEAAYTDPQQRLWLETVWHAFEDAACDPFNYQGPIGVFAGAFQNTYLLNNILRDPVLYENYIRLRGTENFQVYLGNEPGFIPTRTAYMYNLKGPAISVQTACSSSLIAVSQACNSLLTHESDICLAGGVCILTPQETGYKFQEGAINSSDGHCRPFDKTGKGTIFSNGLGIVVLKRLDDAIKDGNRIYAVIKGWATNNDGNQKIGFTAPSVNGQAEAISIAQNLSGFHPDEFIYIEAHGTATPLGDPIEIAGLTKAFRAKSVKKQFCGIGSVKSNIGHLDAAAGITGLIKVALSAYHKKIPATLHYQEANPNIDFENSPFFVVDKTIEWDNAQPMVMGVSSFGIGGTNAHIVISDYKPVNTANKAERPLIYPLSARSEFSLNKMKENLVDHLSHLADIEKPKVAYTLQAGRNHMPVRSFAVGLDNEVINLSAFSDAQNNSASKEIVFMFPGQGAQFVSMGKGLYESEPVFRTIVDECLQIFEQITGQNLKTIIFSGNSEEAELQLAQTHFTQPGLFIIEYATARLYMHYGVCPQYSIGHSIGEYVAACIAGVFELKDALAIVTKRGELMQKMPGGTMWAVKAKANLLKELPLGYFEIAAINSQEMCTISFQSQDIEKVTELLASISLKGIPLNTSHAFHSQSFDPILGEFQQFVDSYKKNAPKIPFISCLTGDLITSSQATSGIYWAKQLRNTVLFASGIEKLSVSENIVFLEVGPNTHLSGLVRQNDAVKNKSLILKSIGKREEGSEQISFYKSLGELWLRGVKPNFIVFYGSTIPGNVSLPNYPFEHKRYWLDYHPNGDIVSTKNNFTSKEIAETKSAAIHDTSLKGSVKAILAELSGYQTNELKDDKKFEDFGFDSLFLARFAGILEREYKCPIEFRKLVYEYPNLNTLTEYLQSNSPVSLRENKKTVITIKKNSYLNNFTPFQTQGDGIPLIMVHGDDLNIHLPQTLGKTRPYLGYLHLSADGHKNPFTTVQQMAAHYLKQLLEYKPQGPYIIGGFSFGGILAFEMALQLEKMGQKVPLLLVMDCGTAEARTRYDDISAEKKAYEAPKKIQNIVYFVNKYYYKVYYKSIRIIRNGFFLISHRLPVKFRRKYVYDLYTNLSLRYCIGGKYTGDTVIFKASENHSDMKYLGWDKYTNNIIEVVEMIGNHETVLKNQDSLNIIIKKINQYINEYTK